MHKLRNEMMNLKIMINSSYGMSGVSLSLYDEMLKKKLNDPKKLAEKVKKASNFCQQIIDAALGGKKAITPSIAGQAWITGSHIHTLDPTDPWPLGYKLSDTWPNKL